MEQRILAWNGCVNVRDLGGLKTCDGRRTRWGALVRSDSPVYLTAAGWEALYAHGIRTIVSLCTHGLVEEKLDIVPPYSDLIVVKVPIEDVTDADFVQQWVNSGWWSTPLYYKDALRRWPGRHAAAISAIAQAQPGGVLFHCIRGHDRTGIIALLVLMLAGVTPDEIVADYVLSLDPERDKLLAREHLSVRDVILETVAGLEVEAYLSAGGVTQTELAAVRRRLVG